MSLRVKLILLFLAVALIPLFFVSALTFHNYKTSLETSLLSNLKDITALKADKTEAFFSSLKDSIETARSFYNIKKNLPILTAYVGDPNHPEFIAAKQALDEQLQHVQSVLHLMDIMLVNPDGKVVYSSDSGHHPLDLLNFLSGPAQTAFEEGKTKIFLSDIFPNQKDGNKPILLITAPAVNLDGFFSGVIVFEVDTTAMYEIIQDVTGLGKTGEVLIGKKEGNRVIFLTPLKFDPNAALKRTADIGGQLALPMQQAVGGKTGAGSLIDYRGQNVVAAWRHIPSLNWGLVAKIDTEEAFIEVTKLRNLAMIILAIVVVLSGVTAYSIARYIAEPIQKLSEGAAIIGRGNLDHKIGLTLKDEIGQLSRTFDTMTGDLKQTLASRDELNKEIEERRQAEEALAASEQNVRLKLYSILSPEGDIGNLALADIIDTPTLQALLTHFYELVHIPMAIIDLDGKTLVGVGWQDICTQFHRVNSQTCQYCHESDMELSAGAEEGKFKLYKCRNNLWDAATPIIIGGKKMGNLFTGQFFFDDETPDYDLFRGQARKYGFDEEKYMAALDRVARLSRETVNRSMEFLHGLASLISQTSYGNIKLARLLEEQKQTEQALRKSEQSNKFLADLVKSASLAVGVGYPDGRLGMVNAAFEKLTGYTIEELQSSNWAETLTPPQWRQVEREKLEELGRSGKPVQYEKEYIRKDGTRIPIELLVHLVKDADGNPQYYYSFINDITERKRAETALRESQLDLNRAQAVAHVGSWRLDIQRDTLTWSEEAYRIFNIPKSMPLTYELFLEHVHPDDRQHLDAKWKAALAGEKYDVEHRIIVDGKIKWVREKAELELDKEGVLLGGFGTVTDITERKQAEEALRESEERFRTMLNAMGQLAWIARADGYIFWYNQRWYDYTGTTAEQMEGWGWQSVHDPVLLPKILEQWKASIAQGTLFEMGFPLRRADGQFRQFLTRGIPIKDAEGHVVQWFGTNTDVNDIKQAEEAIKRAATRFEILSQTAGQLLESKDPQQVIDIFCHKVMEFLDCHIFVNYFVDESAGRLHLNASGGLPGQMAKDIEWLDFGQAICGRVAQSGQRIVAENIQESCDARADLVRSIGIRAYACHPLLSQDRVLGTLSFGTRSRGAYSDEDLAMMKTVADQVATAMERIRAEKELQKSHDELEIRVRERTADLDEMVRELQSQVEQRIRAEEIIKAERKRFEDVLEMMPAYAVLLTPDYRIAYANRTFRKWFGDDNGKKCYEFLFNHTGPCENCQTYDVLKTRKSQSWEWTGPNGCNYDIYDYPFTDTDGSPLIMEIGVDVTAHKQAQEAVRQGEERYRSLTVATTQVVWITDAQGQVVGDMPSWREFTGQSVEEIQGLGWINALHPNDRDRTAKIWTQSVQNKRIYRIEYRLRRHDGDYRTVAVRGVPVIKPDGSIREWVGTCTDITERKLAEQRQRVTKALLKLFAKNTSRKEYLDAVVKVIRDWSGCEFAGVRIRDAEGNIPYLSHVDFDKEFLALENDLNLKRDNCVCIRSILQGDLQPQEQNLVTAGRSFYCNSGQAFLNSLSDEQKIHYRGHCIKHGFQSIAVIPIRYHDNILGAIHIADYQKDMVPLSKVQFIETTAATLIGEAVHRFNAEEELEQYRLRLEDMVRHQTADLARSNRDLEQFAYVASHDLQEPLRAVSGFVELLKLSLHSSLDAQNAQYMDFAIDGVTRMQSLINGLLEYSRVGTQGKAPEPTDSNAALKQAIFNLQTSIMESGAKIVTNTPLPTVHIDPVQLSQLFQNLLGNALKFRSEQPPEIRIGADRQDTSWRFAVADNGIGIDPQYAGKIFMIFQRLHTRRQYPGTGIGLAVCQKIIERRGGKIWVESAPGQGATFYFTIPDTGDTK
jgi:PAS domain S-box-containing protein